MAGYRTALALAGCCVIAGCLAQPGLPAAGTQFDGVYAGDNTLVRGGGQGCGPVAFPQSTVVLNGRFTYAFSPNPPVVSQIPVQIAADGSFSAKTQYGINEPTPRGLFKLFWFSLTGRVTGATLEATADDQWCVRHILLQRQQ